MVADENLGQLDHKPTPVIYDPYAQDTSRILGVTIRTEGDPAVGGGQHSRRRARDRSCRACWILLITMGTLSSPTWPAVSVRRYPACPRGAFAAWCGAGEYRGFTGCWPTWWRNAPASWASAWLWARSGATCWALVPRERAQAGVTRRSDWSGVRVGGGPDAVGTALRRPLHRCRNFIWGSYVTGRGGAAGELHSGASRGLA